MNIDSIKNGYVIDHITAGHGMELYNLLGLEKLECSVAIIKNVCSKRMERKDIIKIDAAIDVNLDIIGYVDPGITVDVIRDCKVVEKKTMQLPERLSGVLKCRNPRCITSVEQELPHVFTLTDKKNRVYRCLYCEVQGK